MEIYDIDRLDELQMVENEGRGIICVKYIISSLRREDIKEAIYVYKWEGDKIRAYPLVQQWFYDYMGCRLHLKKDCQNSLCLSLKEYNTERVQRESA
ncbi:MAG: hypothetical protein J7L15_00885 [Clostridiales bacterium]|nr:hypothetical protein [Clostridiales bacterium]